VAGNVRIPETKAPTLLSFSSITASYISQKPSLVACSSSLILTKAYSSIFQIKIECPKEFRETTAGLNLSYCAAKLYYYFSSFNSETIYLFQHLSDPKISASKSALQR